jgi:hypothetical protein
MNSDEKSPFYRRLKMLEKRENRFETISQSTFVTNLCEYLISKTPQEDEINIKRKTKIEDNPNLPLRKYFIAYEKKILRTACPCTRLLRRGDFDCAPTICRVLFAWLFNVGDLRVAVALSVYDNNPTVYKVRFFAKNCKAV